MQSGESRATANRRVRQEALRESLAARGLVQHVLDITDKLSNYENDLDSLMVQRLKAAADLQIKLINKYLPDLKSTEITGEGGGDVGVSLSVQVVGVDASRDTE